MRIRQIRNQKKAMHPKMKLNALSFVLTLAEGSFRTLDSAHSLTYDLYEPFAELFPSGLGYTRPTVAVSQESL